MFLLFSFRTALPKKRLSHIHPDLRQGYRHLNLTPTLLQRTPSALRTEFPEKVYLDPSEPLTTLPEIE